MDKSFKPQSTSPALSFTLVFVDNTPPGHKDRYCRTQFETAVKQLRFDVARVKTPYLFRMSQFADALRPGRDQVRLELEDVQGFDALGLACKIDDGGLPQIVGTPLRAFKGDVHIHACSKLNGEKEPDDFEVTRSFEIAEESVDTWPLWQDLPTPTDTPYEAPNQDTLCKTIPLSAPIVVIGASQRGRSHAHQGDFRDDYMTARFADSNPLSRGDDNGEWRYGWHVLTVSDGAGSATFSRKGAQLVCDTMADALFNELNHSSNSAPLTDAVRDSFNERWTRLQTNCFGPVDSMTRSRLKLGETFTRAVYAAYMAVFNEAATLRERTRRHVSVRDYNATALCVAIKRFKGVDGWKSDKLHRRPPVWAILSYWIGDGAVAVYRPNDENRILTLGKGDSGEYAGETRFITSKDEARFDSVEPRVNLTFLRNFEGIILATDGVTDPFFPSDSSMETFSAWQTFWNDKLRAGAPDTFPSLQNEKNGEIAPQKRADALLRWLMFKERGYHDDRTILLALNDKLAARNRSTANDD
ncbi:MAG: protein phosphatase 2C domain-containing protein [Thermoguttaceae bacterium]|nr:protein phosphatase 2C domain-containing protein [Thermoguttaceae bacterium]